MTTYSSVSDISAPSLEGGNIYYFSWIFRTGLCLLFGFGFFYLILLNSLSTRGFDLETLKVERLFLQKTVEKLDISLAIPNSLYALESMEKVQEMEVVKNKLFLEVGMDGEVAFLSDF